MAFSFGIRSLFSPDDDVQGELLAAVRDARASIHMAIYGFTLPQLTDELIAAKGRGLEVHGLFDLSQSQGHFEKEQLERLRQAGVDVVVGTSPKAHQIMHEKGICIDRCRTITGSYNFSRGARDQVNHMDFIYSRERAEWFLEMWNRLHDLMVRQGA